MRKSNKRDTFRYNDDCEIIERALYLPKAAERVGLLCAQFDKVSLLSRSMKRNANSEIKAKVPTQRDCGYFVEVGRKY